MVNLFYLCKSACLLVSLLIGFLVYQSTFFRCLAPRIFAVSYLRLTDSVYLSIGKVFCDSCLHYCQFLFQYNSTEKCIP